MSLALYSFIFLFGLCVGSFVNVLINRLPLGQPIGIERSRCPHCQKKLAWWELVPLFSFIFLRGRCSECGGRISWQYPLVELSTGVSFVLILSKFISVYGLRITSYSMRLGISDFASRINAEELATKCGLPIINLIFWLFVAALLVAIFVIDLKHYIIPNKLVYPGSLVAFLALLANNFLSLKTANIIINSSLVSFWGMPSSYFSFVKFSSFTSHFLSAIIGAGFFLFLLLLTRGKGMGVGDLKLVFFLGLVFGVYLLDVLYLAFLFGGFVGVMLLVFQKKGWKSKVPFGPFLAASSLLFILF